MKKKKNKTEKPTKKEKYKATIVSSRQQFLFQHFSPSLLIHTWTKKKFYLLGCAYAHNLVWYDMHATDRSKISTNYKNNDSNEDDDDDDDSNDEKIMCMHLMPKIMIQNFLFFFSLFTLFIRARVSL